MIACSTAFNSGSNAETMPMRCSSAEKPGSGQKEPISNRASKNVLRARNIESEICRKAVPDNRRARRLRRPEATEDLPRYRAQDPFWRDLRYSRTNNCRLDTSACAELLLGV